MIHLLDSNERIIDVLANKSDKIYWDTKITEDQENNLLTLDFTTLGTIDFTNVRKLTAQDQDGNHRLFVLFDIEKVHDESGLVQIAHADGDHVSLAQDQPIAPTILEGATAETAAQYILANSLYKLGQVDFLGSRTVKFTDFMSPLAALNQIASDFDAVLRFRVEIIGNTIQRYVDILEPVDIFSGKEFVFGKDIIGLKRKENRADIVTRLVGYGPADEDGNFITFESINGGKNYVEDADAYQRWNDGGRHRYGIFQYQPEDTTDVTPQMVLDATKDALKRRNDAMVEYELTGAALEQIMGYEHEKVRVGMTIRIKDTYFEPALYLEAEVLRTEMPEYGDPNGQFSYTFGNYREVTVVVPDEVKAIQKTLFRNANGWTAAKNIAAQALQDAVQAQATADGKITSFYQPDTPTTASEGDLWFDTDDGNKPYIWQNGEWQPAQDSGITEALNRANDAQATADKKVQTFFSDTAPTAEGIGDLWYNPASGTLFRWDGSGWLVVSDVTGMNTAADTAAVNGKPADTVLVDIQNAQSTADAAQTTATNAQTIANAVQSTIDVNKPIWDRGSFFNSDGTLDVSKLKGLLSDDQIASASKWNGRTTMITDSGVYTGTILASQIIADSLSAISANLGNVTAGNITGVRYQSDDGIHYLIMDAGHAEIVDGTFFSIYNNYSVQFGVGDPLSPSKYVCIFMGIDTETQKGYIDSQGSIEIRALAEFLKGIKTEAWHTVTTFQNGWSAYNASSFPVQYMKDPMGFVHLRGLVGGGTQGYNTVFTLPVGYRPQYPEYFGTTQSNIEYVPRIEVTPEGNIYVVNGGTSYTSLSGITFYAGW